MTAKQAHIVGMIDGLTTAYATVRNTSRARALRLLDEQIKTLKREERLVFEHSWIWITSSTGQSSPHWFCAKCGGTTSENPPPMQPIPSGCPQQK